jgi:hypothetical protein
MGHLLELLWRLLDILSHLWDLVVNWRLWVCILLALAVVWVARHLGMPADDGSFILAAGIGLVVGVSALHGNS